MSAAPYLNNPNCAIYGCFGDSALQDFSFDEAPCAVF